MSVDIVGFPHNAPKGYYYETESFKRNVVAIWIHHNRKFDYNLGGNVRCIWGFYNIKNKCFYSPINSKTIGNLVDIDRTTPYSAMIPKLTPLEAAFSV
jgi:hypothetical protein